jgi:hypothetical protein
MLLIVTLSMQMINKIELVTMQTRMLQVQAMVFLFHVRNLKRRHGQVVHTRTGVRPAIAAQLAQKKQRQRLRPRREIRRRDLRGRTGAHLAIGQQVQAISRLGVPKRAKEQRAGIQ